jgi:hypothetical protein
LADPDDFRILAHTVKSPLTSLLLDMKRVKASDAVRLQKALLELSGTAVPDEMLGHGFVKPVSWIPATEGDCGAKKR